MRILLTEDDPSALESLSEFLARAGHEVARARSGEEALARIEESEPDLLLTDIRMPGMDGVALARAVRPGRPRLPVILMTAHATVRDAVAAMKEGVYDYLQKPLDEEELLVLLDRIAERARLLREVSELRRRAQVGAEAIPARSPAMRRVIETARAAAASEATVLVSGETGTGKGRLARFIHTLSERRDGPLVEVNPGALPETLAEAELFGHVRGAFTGATRDASGRFEAARGGTLVLDEVTSIPLSTQVKLLRVLQERVFEPLGANRSIKADVRVIALANEEPEAAVRAGKLREDLFYRLNVVRLHLPPLRERQEDIPLLFEYFLQAASSKGGHPPPEIPAPLMDELLRHSWPGNVRELENLAERLVALGRGGPILAAHLPSPFQERMGDSGTASDASRSLAAQVAAFERRSILEALDRTKGPLTEVAKFLGISERTLRRKLREHDLKPNRR